MIDLDAYLARVGADAEPPSYDALARLQAAHVRTFPFDHIDVLLDQHPGVAAAGGRSRSSSAAAAAATASSTRRSSTRW